MAWIGNPVQASTPDNLVGLAIPRFTVCADAHRRTGNPLKFHAQKPTASAAEAHVVDAG
jgi:hypothetical protein